MSIQTDSGPAARIQRIREAFSEARNEAGLKAPEELVDGFDETFDEYVP